MDRVSSRSRSVDSRMHPSPMPVIRRGMLRRRAFGKPAPWVGNHGRGFTDVASPAPGDGAVPGCRQSSPGRALRPSDVVATATAVYRDLGLARHVVPRSFAQAADRTDVTEAVMNRSTSMLLAATLAVGAAAPALAAQA